MGKKAPNSGGKGGNAKPSNWSLWVFAGVLVVLVAWSSLRQEVRQRKPGSKKTKTKAEVDESSTDDRLDAVREALFSEDGQINFGRQGPGGKQGFGFANQDYWEKRYTKTDQDHYDWYGTWNSESKIRIKPHVQPHMPSKVESVLNVGCGNSRLAEELVKDGFTDVVSVDIAQAAIDRMNEKFKGVQGLRFLQMDATNMTFEDGLFDVAFDKGTLDAMYTGASELVKLAVAQVFRVLKPGGLFVSLTFGPPKARKDLNFTSGVEGEPPGWEYFEIKKLHKEEDGLKDKQTFWMYLMRKPA